NDCPNHYRPSRHGPNTPRSNRYVNFFFVSTSAMEWKDPVKKAKMSLWPTYKVNCLLWPFVQFTNFTMVPMQHRLFFINMANLGRWCGIIPTNLLGADLLKGGVGC